MTRRLTIAFAILALGLSALALATVNGVDKQRTIEVAPDTIRYALYPDGIITPPTGIIASATASRTSCTAPCSVHFDATATTRTGYDAPDVLLGLDYRWDFDDSGAGTWARGARYRGGFAQSKDVEYGFSAAHVFETAGTFAVQLLVTDGTTSDTLNAALTITVAAAATTWATTSTICVSADTLPVAGSGSCPAGASVATQSDFDTIIATTCNLDTAAVRCLLKGGDTFTSNGTTDMTNAGPAMLGSYGTGKATVNKTLTSAGILEIGGTTDLRVVDIAFVGTASDSSTDGPLYVDSTSGDLLTHFLALRVDMTSVNKGIYTRADYPEYHPVTNMHAYNAFVDGTITGAPGAGSGQDVYIMGNFIAMMGNEVSNAKVTSLTLPNDRHTMRVKYARNSIFAHNELGLLRDTDSFEWGCSPGNNGTNWNSQGNEIGKFIAGFAVDIPTPSQGWSGENVLSDNYISKCRNNAFDIGIGATDSGVGKANEHQEYWVVEGNHWAATYGYATGTSAQALNITNTSHIVVRNNVFDSSMPAASSMSYRAVQIQTNSAQTGDGDYVAGDDIRIYNNTMYQQDSETGTRILFAQSSTDVTNIVFSNNLLRSYRTQAVLLNPNTSVVCCGGSCNGSCNLDVNTSPFAATPGFPSTLDDFDYAAASAPLNVGSTLPGWVSRDAAGACRPDATLFDVGHRERSGTVCTGP